MSHPATKQDQWVIEQTRKERLGPGYFVEAGADDGLHHSNTLLLESHGWRGVLIEALLPQCKDCKINRPKAKVVCTVLNDVEEDVWFTEGVGSASVYSGIREYLPPGWFTGKYANNGGVRKRRTRTLTSVLDEVRAPLVIDYLSLNVEGAESTILSEFMLSTKYSARLITAEFRYDVRELNTLIDILEPAYELDEVRGFDACFVRKKR